jgi:hypothetical protein
VTLWTVMYDDWQMGCCGEPFSVGDRVAWTLALREPGDVLDPDSWREDFSELDGSVELVEDEDEDPGVVLRVPGLTALWAAEPPLPARAHATGLLCVEDHILPEEMPLTEGIVRSIRIVTQGYARPAPGEAFEPVAGERWLRAVDSCPKWFDDGGWDGTADYHRRESGALVGLETYP